MRLLHPLPPSLGRVLTVAVLVGWILQMGVLARTVARDSSHGALAGDLGRYGSRAQWKGIYLRGEKIGFSVTQTTPTPDGYEIEEDGRLRMSLLGMSSAAKLHSSVRVDSTFTLRSFTFALDPGTGSVEIEGRVEGRLLHIAYHTAAGVREESRPLPDAPALALNLPRRLVSEGLAVGRHYELTLLDPVTLKNSVATVDVLKREIVQAMGRPIPTYRLRSRFLGMESTTWMTDTGEVVREESALGMVVIKESAKRATTMNVTGSAGADLIDAASVVPRSRVQIDDPTQVESLRLDVQGADDLLAGPDAQGAGQTVSGRRVDLVQASLLQPDAYDSESARSLGPEPLLESDDPAIRDEAARVVGTLSDPRARAERLLRHVNAIIEKRPTMSLPSATEVLRTRVGDCNEHTVLFVALARAAHLPARIAVGLVYLYGAFHYHAWAEVYLAGPPGRGLWLPVDPTLNQFPADATHFRLARGGLDRQATIVGTIGKIAITIVDLKMQPGWQRVVVGRSREDPRPIEIPLPRRTGGRYTCWGGDQ
jgi:transglutaminase-like putative cysteine protease